jgi:hypothetical protein
MSAVTPKAEVNSERLRPRYGPLRVDDPAVGSRRWSRRRALDKTLKPAPALFNVLHGSARYGERAEAARNLARAFETSRRHDVLSFKHRAEAGRRAGRLPLAVNR